MNIWVEGRQRVKDKGKMLGGRKRESREGREKKE